MVYEFDEFDKVALAIATLHTSDIKRSICHEQIVQALRDVKNAAITAERQRIVEAVEGLTRYEPTWDTLCSIDAAADGDLLVRDDVLQAIQGG